MIDATSSLALFLLYCLHIANYNFTFLREILLTSQILFPVTQETSAKNATKNKPKCEPKFHVSSAGEENRPLSPKRVYEHHQSSIIPKKPETHALNHASLTLATEEVGGIFQQLKR